MEPLFVRVRLGLPPSAALHVPSDKDGETKLINRKALGKLGGLSMYVYILHYSVIIWVYVLAPQIAETSVPLYVGVVIAIVLAVSVAASQIDRKLQPWLKMEPWFKK